MTIIEDACRQFSTRRFPLPSRSQVDQLEQSIGVTFPEDYRQYILDYNGGYFIEPWITPVVDGCPKCDSPRLSDIGGSVVEYLVRAGDDCD